MASRDSNRATVAATIGVVIVAGLTIGCSPAMPQAPATPSARSATPNAATASARSGSPVVGGGPSPTLAGLDAPPDALLGAEGGDPVEGQLGTYVWLDTGSDAPWLPGAPLTVGAGEPLTLRLDPDGDIGAWAARYVAAGAAGPDGAIALGEGSGLPVFEAPRAGTWTVEVFVEFAAGAGDASYFWRLRVE
jgi:hypothetical protein